MSCTTFSFSYPDMIRIPLQDDIVLKMNRDSIATACVSFVNKNINLNVPDGITIKNITDNEIVLPVFNTQYFILGWTCSYEISFNENLVVSLVNKRDWDPDNMFISPEHREWNVYIEKKE